MNNENFFVIQGWMRNEYNLSGNELLIYALIYGFSNAGQNEFSGSITYLEKCTGASKNTVVRSLKKLVENGFLKKKIVVKNGVSLNRYKVKKRYTQNGYGGVPKMGGGCTQNGSQGIPKMGTNNIVDNIDDNIYVDSTRKKRFKPPTVEEVKAYFQEKGFREEIAVKAFEYYEIGNWIDSRGNPVKNWKQKMFTNWMKQENKIQEDKTSGIC